MLLPVWTKELLDAEDIGKLRPQWDSLFTVTTCQSLNAYTLALPRWMLCSPTVNVDSLKPFFERLGTSLAPGLVFDAGQEGEHEVELLLNRRLPAAAGARRHALPASSTWCCGGATRRRMTSGCWLRN